MFYLSLEYFSFSAWNYFLWSGYVFSIFFAISASIFLVWKYQWLNIKCQDINQYIDQIMWVIISPFDMWYHWSAILALDYNIDDIRAATQTTIENTKQIVKWWNNIIWDIKNPNNIIGWSIGNLTNKVENSEVISNLKGQVWELTTQAQEVLENVNENKNLLSLYYCNKILESLDTVSQGARIITIIVFTLLFWSVIRLVVYIFWVLAYILFKILELLSIYKTRKIKKDAKEIV